MFNEANDADVEPRYFRRVVPMENLRRWLVGPLLALAACGGGVGGGGGGIAIQDLGSRDSEAECSRAVRCGFYPDQPTCVAANPSILGQLMADVQAGKIKYDGTAASDCLNAFATESCTQSGANAFRYPKACDEAFQGTAVAGAPCFISQECVSGSCTLPPSATGTTCIAGTCDAVFVPIAQGGNCTIDGPEFQCVDGTDCRVTAGGTNRTCQRLVALGGACLTEEDCADGAGCFGTCQAYPSEGQPCDPNGVPCDAFFDACDAPSLTCVHRIGARGGLGTARPVPPVCP
jgi:hypothetical protein